jgi:multidrug efflux pump subunit AcrA (membrane-fusion protein)
VNGRRGVNYILRVAIVLVVIAGSLWAVRRWRHSSSAPDLPTANVKKGEFLVMVRSRGELVARRSIQLSAPIDVPDLQIVFLAPPGSAVKTGQVVIRFDPSKPRQDLKEKKVALDQAQATLDQAVAQARITADQDRLDLSTAQYAEEKARLEASKQTIVSAMEGQKSAIDLGLAAEKVKVQAATTGLHAKSDEAKIASLARLRDAARAEVELIEYRLTLMDLTSPLDGVINYMSNRTQGWMNAQPFKVGDHAVGGTVLAEIPDLKTLEMESKVEEGDRGRIQMGDESLVHVDAYPEKVVSGKITSISLLTEESFNEWPPTRSFRAFASLNNPEGSMRPGMNAGADIIEQKLQNVTSIPAKALFTAMGKPTVYVKQGQQFVARQVKVLARNPDEVAIEGPPAGTKVALLEPALQK